MGQWRRWSARIGCAGALVALSVLGSAPSVEATPSVPGPPVAVSAIVGNGAVSITWTVGDDGGDAITDFIVTSYVDGGSPTPYTWVAGAVGSPTDPTPGAVDSVSLDLPVESDYTFTVTSENADGTGSASAMTEPVAVTSAPGYPTDFRAIATATTITLQWTVGVDNGLPVTSFNFYVLPIDGTSSERVFAIPAGAVGSSLDPTPGAVDSAMMPNIVAGVDYEFWVAETNADGTGENSAYAPGARSVSAELQIPVLVVAQISASLAFGSILLGDISYAQNVYLYNHGPIADHVTGFEYRGADPDDFVVESSTCQTIAVDGSCQLTVGFLPGALGTRSATLTPVDGSSKPPTVTLGGTGVEGYYTATSNGAVYGYGVAPLYGDASGAPLARPVVAIQATGDGGGYWLVASDGGVFAFGDAGFYGSTGAILLNRPIVGMATTPDGKGYWLVASDGGIFAFGDAGFHGSTGAIHLNQPIVGMATTPDGKGYWLVASDGGIFAFGDAAFHGSTGAVHLNRPIVGMAATPDGKGYWLVASDGGIFAFGDAGFHGSTGAIRLNQPIVGMAPTPDGRGYWLTAADGGVFNFGDAPYDGSAGSLGRADFIGMSGTGPPTLQAILGAPALARTGRGPTPVRIEPGAARFSRPGRLTLAGGRDRRRSGDLTLFRRALYQLSYPTSPRAEDRGGGPDGI